MVIAVVVAVVVMVVRKADAQGTIAQQAWVVA
jgi:hypothetical protein